MHHVVRKGETLFMISKYYNTNLQQMLLLNPMISNPDRIFPGQIVRVR